jgi:hypothetical protein
MYGRRNLISRPIYGTGCVTTYNDCLGSELSVLLTLKDLLGAVANVVDKCFISSGGVRARVVGNLSVASEMSPAVFVRLIWLNTHKNQRYTNSAIQQLEIINIYLQHPTLNWRDDKYIKITLPELPV